MLNSNHIHKIYFLAICGTGMASLAAMMKEMGYTVYGVDQDVYPPMSTFLAEQGIPVYDGWSVGHLNTKPDLVVVGNAVSRGNPELEALLNAHLPYISLPDALKEFCIRGHRSIVVTGTHGKTTTSALLAWILEFAEQSPHFMIGGIPKNFDRGFQIGRGECFVLEGDEYDSAYFDKTAKFLHYLPDIGIITSIEFDHADIYHSIDDVQLAFKRFVNLIPSQGLLVVSQENQIAMQISEKAFCPVVSFGLSNFADWSVADVSVEEQGSVFTILKNTLTWQRVRIPLYGEHNLRNTLAAVITADHIGIDAQTIAAALAEFKGIRRRLEWMGSMAGVDIFDDFGHHPTAVKETLSGLRARFPKRRILALYEPRSATSRRNVFQSEWPLAFELAEVVLVAPVHRPEKAPLDQLFSSEKLVNDIIKSGKTGAYLDIDAMVNYLIKHIQKDDIIITFSNGPFGDIHNKLLTHLK